MKEQNDDAISSVKEVDSAKSDEIVAKRAKIEGIFGERESEDMVVDVVSADVAVESETGARDQVMEDADGVVESRGKSLEKVEVVVVKEVVVEENLVSESGCDDRKPGNGPVVGDSEVDKAGEGEVEVRDSVQEVADGDRVVDEKNKKETEVLDSVTIPESTEGQVVIEEGVKNQSLSGEVVDEGPCEDNDDESVKNTEVQAGVDQTKKESFESATEANDDASVKNMEVQAEVDQTKKESFESATEDMATNDSQKSGGATEETVERPTESVQEAAADVDCVMSEKTGKDEILDGAKIPDLGTKVDEVITKEGLADGESVDQSKIVNTGTCEQPTESVQEAAADVDCAMSEKTGKDEILDGAKIPDLGTKVDEVITKEGLADGESVDQSKFVNTGTREGAAVQENAEVDQKSKEESSTIEDSKMVDAPEFIKGEIDVIDKGDGDQDSSKSQQSSIMASLGLEDVDVVVVDEVIEGKNEEQDSVPVEPSLVNPDDQSIATEVVNAGTGEVDQKAEVDLTNKDDSPLATINPDEVTIAQKEPNSDVQVSTDGGILVENQSIDVNVVIDSSEPDVVAYTEPGSSANKVADTDTEVQSFKVEPATIGHNSNEFQVDQGLDASVPDSIGGQHGGLPANSEFSYEDAHTERGEDAGMDIDEVLGWKDEIPPVQEDGQMVDPTNLSNVEMQETEALEHTFESEQLNKTPVSLKQSCYFHPPTNEGEFSVSDLVWGKVRSHPWWPGQIFDPSDASEKAMKHHKKDCFLVAYFGDRTFAWNDSAVLKPFRENFSQIVDHMDSEGFNNAVHCALQEVSRRVELGLTCSCIPHEIYENIKCQIVENSGIKQESSRRHGVDNSASVSSFEADMLVDYVRLLAKVPYGEGDKMELTIAKAQLSSYGRFKGHRQLAEFQSCGDLLEAEQVVKDETYSEDGSKKRKALDSISDASKPSFKVGGSIQKVSSQLTGPPEQVDMLSQLHQAAQDPRKGYGFVNNIIPFFNTHRATVLSKSSLNSPNDARKRKTSNENQSEDFEFDDVNDSYWTDRIIQNNSEENPLQENQNGGGAHQIMAYEQETQPVKPARRSNKKRFFSSNHEIEAKEQSELIERRRKNLATEVLMKFTEGVYFPSEIHLNKMFRRFGPLMESETEVDRQGGRARVVFKKCSDAEVAHGSAGKFNIFGSINVHYELNYTPLISYKPLPLPAQDPANAC